MSGKSLRFKRGEKLIREQIRQGIGAPPTPIVKEGDTVTRGQVIAQNDPEKLSVPLHASVTGVVAKVTEEEIIIDQTSDGMDYIPLNVEGSYSEIVRSSGLIGLGGAGFPTYVKMNTQLKPGGYILCNAAECEPVLRHNMEQIEQNPSHLVEAIKLAMESTGAEKGIIGIKLKHKDVIKKLTSTLKEMNEKAVRVLPLRNVYPVGEERALMRDTINVLLPPGALPVEGNAVVFNVETLYAIRDAIVDKKPYIDKYVTIAGKLKDLKKGESAVVHVPIGTPIKVLIDQFGGIDGDIGEILIGGPYTGRRADENAVIDKISGGVTFTDLFDEQPKKLGIIQCACGPLEPRLRQIAESMGSEVVGLQVCKNAHEQKVGYKCQDPGNCPGQAEKVMALKKAGAEAVLIGHCTDCTNTVMGSAPKLGMDVHHATDHVMKTMGLHYIRTFDENLL